MDVPPLPTGVLLSSGVALTAAQRDQLKRLGIELPPEAGIPADAVRAGREAGREIEKEPVVLPEDAPRLEVTPIDVADLPEDRKKSVLAAVAACREEQKARTTSAGKVDLRKKVDLSPSQPSPRPARPVTSADSPETPPPSPSSAPPAEAPVETPAAVAAKSFCNHCGWEHNRKDEECEDVDKLSYLQAVLGGVRFHKSYPLMGGRVRVTFRTLTSAESDLCYTQLAHDVRAEKILQPGQYFRNLADYRLCLGLARLEVGGTRTELHTLDGYEFDKPGVNETVLGQLVDYLYKNALSQETLRRSAAACYFRFERLVEHLEARVDDPNFWPAIGERP